MSSAEASSPVAALTIAGPVRNIWAWSLTMIVQSVSAGE